MGRVEENKLQKQNSLMDTAFQLFTSQGIAKTSIADISLPTSFRLPAKTTESTIPRS